MADMTLFLVGLFLLLAAAVLIGELATRLGQPALVGQLVVGVLLGPTLLGPELGLSASNLELSGIQFLATFFLLVTAGLEISPEQIYSTGLSAAVLALAVLLGPFALGAFLIPLLFPGISLVTALFISLTLSITALPVMGVMLTEFRLTKTPMGLLLLNASVINELVAVAIFSILLKLGSGTGAVSAAIAVGSVALFLTTILSIHMGLRVLRESRAWYGITARFRRTWKSKEAGFAVLMVMALGSALYSQFLGLTFLVGAFYAGLLVTPESAGKPQHRSISQVFDAMSWGFFVPLFFAFVGLGMNLTTLTTSTWILALFGLLAAFAIGSKVGIGAVVARWLGWKPSDALAIGFMVSSRGAVELAMAVILLQEGVFSTQVYTIVAGVGLVTTVVAPIGAAFFGGFSKGGVAEAPGSGFGRPLEPVEPAIGSPTPSAASSSRASRL